MTDRTLRLGSRWSPMAIAQSRQVAAMITERTGREVQIVGVTTLGDVSRAQLAQIGGTGVFAGALRQALLGGQVDLAVHSLKDLPAGPAAGIVLAAVPPRDDPRDALVARDGAKLADLPPGARIGTGSPRRAAQLLALRADLRCVPIRGNANTRLAKVGSGELDAVVLACAGLARIGHTNAIKQVFEPGEMLPAPGQGALAVECRAAQTELAALLGAVSDPAAMAAVTAERSLLEALAAGCSAPVAAYAEGTRQLRMLAAVMSPDGRRVLRAYGGTPVGGASKLGRDLAAELLRAGARDLIAGDATSQVTRRRLTAQVNHARSGSKKLFFRTGVVRVIGTGAAPGWRSGDLVRSWRTIRKVRPAARSPAAPVVSAVHRGIVYRGALVARLAGAARVTLISAPAGSGKTFLLRSWLGETGLTSRAAWVPVQGQERDPQRFWISVADALRGTTAGSTLVRELTAAPGLDGWAITERLLKDLAPLDAPIWLVIDDLYELGPDEALRQLELLVMRGPPQLRLVLATRHDLRLGLHRLRLEGELTEIRADDLPFSLAEGRELFAAAGVELPEPALVMLHQRTEGWAAGLRLAALSLAGHPDPGRFAAEFSGSERTVAEYLLAEVLERQSEAVRSLLLRTSVLERVNGYLADLLTSGSGSERILQDLEQAGAFVVSLDARRSWFRYHQMFADLLELELRRTAPEKVTGLHAAAAGWFAGHGYPVEAIRHAQAARAWDLAARLLSDHWVSLALDGQAATAQALLDGFPTGVVAADAELTALRAFDELERGSLEEAGRQHELAARMPESLPGGRRDHFHLTLTVLRLFLARQRGDLPAAVEEARLLLASVKALDAPADGRSDDLCALALISLGIAETWSVRYEDANRHLEQGVALAARIGRPYLEILGLAHWAVVAYMLPSPAAANSGTRAIELARRHGWTNEPVAAAACVAFGSQLLWQGRLDEAASWLEQGERVIREDADPVIGLGLAYDRGVLELARGRDQDALAALARAERLAGRIVAHHALAIKTRAFLLHTRVRLGQTQRVEQALGEMELPEREAGETRIALAALRLAQDNPQAASAALTPVLDGSAPVMEPRGWRVQAFLLEAIARAALGDVAAAGRAVERALDLADPDVAMLPFLLHPAPELLSRHARHGTAHAALITRILDLLASKPPRSVSASPAGLHTPLSDSEIRVLRYLPTNLSAPEIASELSLSLNTVRTHMRHIYQEIGAHGRTEAVERARALGLLAPSSRKR